MSFVLAANGNHCQDFMERQAPYMIDFRNGEKRDYLRICGKLVLWFCCKKSGYFTKPVKNITNGIFICHKQVNNDTKSNSYSLKRQ